MRGFLWKGLLLCIDWGEIIINREDLIVSVDVQRCPPSVIGTILRSLRAYAGRLEWSACWSIEYAFMKCLHWQHPEKPVFMRASGLFDERLFMEGCMNLQRRWNSMNNKRLLERCESFMSELGVSIKWVLQECPDLCERFLCMALWIV